MRGDVGLRAIAVGSRTALGGVGVCEGNLMAVTPPDVWAVWSRLDIMGVTLSRRECLAAADGGSEAVAWLVLVLEEKAGCPLYGASCPAAVH